MVKKLVCAWGINDIEGSYGTIYYYKWHAMLQRVKSDTYLAKRPTYKECDICEEWKYISKFKGWFDSNYIENYVLDKDLYIPNNKVYSPETCLFIPNNINQLINKQNVGGYSKRPSGNYQVRMNIGGKLKILGTYKMEKEAHQVYIEFKANRYIDIADEWWGINDKIAIGLYRNAEYLLGNNWKDLPY